MWLRDGVMSLTQTKETDVILRLLDVAKVEGNESDSEK